MIRGLRRWAWHIVGAVVGVALLGSAGAFVLSVLGPATPLPPSPTALTPPTPRPSTAATSTTLPPLTTTTLLVGQWRDFTTRDGRYSISAPTELTRRVSEFQIDEYWGFDYRRYSMGLSLWPKPPGLSGYPALEAIELRRRKPTTPDTTYRSTRGVNASRLTVTAVEDIKGIRNRRYFVEATTMVVEVDCSDNSANGTSRDEADRECQRFVDSLSINY